MNRLIEASKVRELRNSKLKVLDPLDTLVEFFTNSVEKLGELNTYRQSLRDVPQENFKKDVELVAEDVLWPTTPLWLQAWEDSMTTVYTRHKDILDRLKKVEQYIGI